LPSTGFLEPFRVWMAHFLHGNSGYGEPTFYTRVAITGQINSQGFIPKF
jgi:hypothetical protein